MRLLRLVRFAGTVVLVTLAVVISAADSPAIPAGLRAQKDRASATDFTLTDETGTTVRLSSFRGHVVLLDFWATWCTGCKVEIPWYMEFQKQYGRAGLRSIGVAMDEEGWQKVNPYLEAHPINYPIVLGNPELMEPYKITSLPVTLLIDREGNIADAHVGLVDKDSWEKGIQLLLKEKQPKHH